MGLPPFLLRGSLPDSVGKIHGNGRSDLEDLAFPNLPPREADEIGRRVCLRKLRTVDSENMQLLPQRVKSCSVSGSALLTSSVRNHARSAFKRFSHPLPFAYLARGTGKDWRSKFDGSDTISVYFSHSFTHTIWKKTYLVCLSCFSAASIFSGVMGRSRIRTPTAS